MTELSADQILEKLLIATSDIRSFQLETRTTIKPGQDYWWTEYFWLRDGADSYLALTFGENPAASEESLFYRGIPYRRTPSGDWESNAPANWNAIDQQASSDFTLAGRDDSERAEMIYGIKFQFIGGLKRLPDETMEGATMLRLSGDYTDWTSFRASALWPDEVDPSEDADIDVEARGTIDLWVDSQTFRITKAETVLAPVDEATEAKAYTSLRYTKFNEAELRGPLP